MSYKSAFPFPVHILYNKKGDWWAMYYDKYDDIYQWPCDSISDLPYYQVRTIIKDEVYGVFIQSRIGGDYALSLGKTLINHYLDVYNLKEK